MIMYSHSNKKGPLRMEGSSAAPCQWKTTGTVQSAHDLFTHATPLTGPTRTCFSLIYLIVIYFFFYYFKKKIHFDVCFIRVIHFVSGRRRVSRVSVCLNSIKFSVCFINY